MIQCLGPIWNVLQFPRIFSANVLYSGECLLQVLLVADDPLRYGSELGQEM